MDTKNRFMAVQEGTAANGTHLPIVPAPETTAMK